MLLSNLSNQFQCVVKYKAAATKSLSALDILADVMLLDLAASEPMVHIEMSQTTIIAGKVYNKNCKGMLFESPQGTISLPKVTNLLPGVDPDACVDVKV